MAVFTRPLLWIIKTQKLTDGFTIATSINRWEQEELRGGWKPLVAGKWCLYPRSDNVSHFSHSATESHIAIPLAHCAGVASCPDMNLITQYQTWKVITNVSVLEISSLGKCVFMEGKKIDNLLITQCTLCVRCCQHLLFVFPMDWKCFIVLNNIAGLAASVINVFQRRFDIFYPMGALTAARSQKI